MKIIYCFLLVLALTSVYAKSIGDVQPLPIEPSTGPVSATQAQKDQQNKLLEAMFQIAQARIAQQMWNIFNS